MTRAANDATLQKAGDIYHQSDSPFHSWNNIKKTEKLKRLKDIGAISKKNEETFRNQYNRIFGDSYDESLLLEILDKFTIEAAKTSIDGISRSCYFKR